MNAPLGRPPRTASPSMSIFGKIFGQKSPSEKSTDGGSATVAATACITRKFATAFGNASVEVQGEMLCGRAHHVIYFESPAHWWKYPEWPTIVATRSSPASRASSANPVTSMTEPDRHIGTPMAPFTLPPGYHRIKLVKSFEELVTTPFGDGVNALCWPRTLPGNFGEVVEQLGVSDEMATLDEARLRSLPLSDAGRAAVDVLLADQQLIRDPRPRPPSSIAFMVILRDDDPTRPCPPIVYSFHVDSAPVETDTRRRVAIPRRPLQRRPAQRRSATARGCPRKPGPNCSSTSVGEDNAGFREYLEENCFDLHYAPVPQARPFFLRPWQFPGASPSNTPAARSLLASTALPKPCARPSSALAVDQLNSTSSISA